MDYKRIFESVESTLFEIGSKRIPLHEIRAQLEPFKHFEGRRLSDEQIFRKLVHIAFYSGFRAQTVSDKIPIIDRHFQDYRVVANYTDRDIRRILDDPQMIRHQRKIKACVENAKKLKALIRTSGSFADFVESLPSASSSDEIIGLRDRFQRLFGYLGERTAFHFMMDIGIPVLKPDRVIERIFKRLGLVPENLVGDALYVALIQEGRKFAQATGHPIRYIDIIFVDYGQVQDKSIGLDRGVCLEVDPACSVCKVREYCSYWDRFGLRKCS